MRRTEQLQGLRMLKMRDVLSGWEAGRLSQLEAPLDLVITMDDATSAIYSAVLIEEEGTQSSFLGLSETIAAHGLPCSLYSDRGSHYFHTPEAGGKLARGVLTQVGRALAQLGIEHIPAYSPQARGRCERAFRTLQDRLPKELRLACITTIEAANRVLKEDYLPRHNARFAIAPAEAGSAFVPVDEAQWRDVLAIQEERTVAPDNSAPAARRGGRRHRNPPARASSACAPAGALWKAWTSRNGSPTPRTGATPPSGQFMCYINRTISRALYKASELARRA